MRDTDVDIRELSADEASKLLKQLHGRATILGSEPSRVEFNELLAIVKSHSAERQPAISKKRRKNPYGK